MNNTDDLLNSLDNLMGEIESSNSSEKDVNLPGWVSKKDASYGAYLAILELEVEKKAYINSGEFRTLKYVKKSNYSITNAEVAIRVGKSSKTLFNTSSYSTTLVCEHLNPINEVLISLYENKNEKIKKRSGLRNKKKSIVVSELQDARNQIGELELKLARRAYEHCIDNIPLDIRSRLRID